MMPPDRQARRFVMLAAMYRRRAFARVPSSRQSAADALMVRLAFEQANDRVIEQERMVAGARIMLASWIGDEAKRPLGDPPDTAASRIRARIYWRN